MPRQMTVQPLLAEAPQKCSQRSTKSSRRSTRLPSRLFSVCSVRRHSLLARAGAPVNLNPSCTRAQKHAVLLTARSANGRYSNGSANVLRQLPNSHAPGQHDVPHAVCVCAPCSTLLGDGMIRCRRQIQQIFERGRAGAQQGAARRAP